MKNLVKFLFFAVLSTATAACGSETNSEQTDSATVVDETIPDNVDIATENQPYSYADIVKNQDSLVGDFGWTRKHELDLNNDGVNEEFLAVEGYSRGMGYVLFTKSGSSWKLLTDVETVPSSDAGIVKLDAEHNGWHDFTASQGSGRGGIIETTFTWDGTKYILKEQKEVTE